MIQFILNNERIETTANAGITLLDFIRQHQQLKGTKIGCREGDCGACTILVGQLVNNTVTYQSITSCISPLGNAHGKHIVTIEGINLPKQLNVAQQLMTDAYATQCGFCTPGFVVSMTGFALQQKNFSTCNDAVSGNICRCTGYKSIEKAGNALEEKLQHKATNNNLDWLIAQKFIPAYFKEIPKKLATITNAFPNIANATVKIANGTDLYVRDADALAETTVHLLANQTQLKGITFSKDGICTLGANTTVTEIAQHKKLQSLFPKLQQHLKLVSSEQIRNMGTLGGNFVNASPIGDLSIFFLALNATLTLVHNNGTERQLPFHQFHTGYKTYDLQAEEILKSISFKVLQTNEHFNFEKVSKRTHLDIASVNAAGRIQTKDQQIITAHFSLGGVAATPKYLTKTNAFLTGKQLNTTNIKAAEEILQSEITPISDVRGTTIYKRLLARQLFFAHFITLYPTFVESQKLIA